MPSPSPWVLRERESELMVMTKVVVSVEMAVEIGLVAVILITYKLSQN